MSVRELAKDLRADLSVALRAGDEAAKAVEDGGSMSLDMVFIPVGAVFRIKRRNVRILGVLNAFGDAFESDAKMWRGYLFTPPRVLGCASKRLAQCEAIAKALNSWDAAVFYRMD
jgi:hypothetical protein